jgi:hypothetical protein
VLNSKKLLSWNLSHATSFVQLVSSVHDLPKTSLRMKSLFTLQQVARDSTWYFSWAHVICSEVITWYVSCHVMLWGWSHISWGHDLSTDLKSRDFTWVDVTWCQINCGHVIWNHVNTRRVMPHEVRSYISSRGVSWLRVASFFGRFHSCKIRLD